MTALRDRHVLVTGAGSGIGAATARALLLEGARVHATARDLDALRAELGQAALDDGRLVLHRLDVTDGAAVREVVAAAGAGDPLEAIVCVAGTNVRERSLERLTPAGWQEVVDTNLTGVFSCVGGALPQLRATRGHAVVVSSVSALWPDISGPAYQASKAGVLAFVRAAALEEHEKGVRFTAVLPGIVATGFVGKRPEPPPEAVLAAALAPEDVAATIVFALSMPARACVAELTVLPTVLQSVGKHS